MLSILKANYKNEYKILVEFSDHKKGEVDLKNFIINSKIKPFKELENIEKFKQFQVDYTLKWNDDLDLAPEYLYFKAFGNDSSLQSKFHEWGYV
ncbi:MAG: Unknown protein [uncultured Campylobacterales bacterium]|uniref:DUF2442 domain-containing protein n=1 Tax=uncultured Campylobacterales bacterium TaxID=352960 RepID=A0A6S6SRA4_9BACT|nr:MAG: Unknown protein [uncultured Campylobacterales bacterium]